MPQQKQTEAEKEYYEQTNFSHDGLLNNLFLRHGQQPDFETRQLTSTYDLSYNQQVRPQVQIYSKYEQNKTQFKQKAKPEEVVNKVHHIVPDIKESMSQRLVNKKDTFNTNYKKIPLRK